MTTRREETAARLDPRARIVLERTRAGRARRLAFEALFDRPPTVDEIRFDFGEDGDELPDSHEHSLDAYDCVRVLLARIRELEEK